MIPQTDWWREFFSGSVLDFVRYARDPETTLAEVDFLEQFLDLKPGARVLDVPCGGGRLSLELATRGYDLVGVDFNADLLASARREADKRAVSLSFRQRDMRDLSGKGEFDAAFSFWNSFGYFDDPDNAGFLESVAASLKPGGLFVLDTPLVETLLPQIEAEERVWWRAGSLIALEERCFDHETSRVESDWTLIDAGQREEKHLSLRLYTYRELTAMLEQAGFGAHRAFGSLDGEPFQLGAPWLYLVTTRSAGMV